MESLETFVQQIIDEVLDRLNNETNVALAACTNCCTTGCVHRMQAAVAAGASRLGLVSLDSLSARDMGQYIDHTLLKAEATRAEINQLCLEAAKYHFASVCVNPIWVKESAKQLCASGVEVCTVVGFPLGANASDTKVYEARRAIFEGAREIDMVIQIGALKSQDYNLVEDDIAMLANAVHREDALLKVIIETALLTDEEKIKACLLSKSAGADYVKTSTGFSKAGATVKDVSLMRRVVGADMGVKAAGGVRDFTGAKEMLMAGATRIGASVGVKIVQNMSASANTNY